VAWEKILAKILLHYCCSAPHIKLLSRSIRPVCRPVLSPPLSCLRRILRMSQNTDAACVFCAFLLPRLCASLPRCFSHLKLFQRRSNSLLSLSAKSLCATVAALRTSTTRSATSFAHLADGCGSRAPEKDTSPAGNTLHGRSDRNSVSRWVNSHQYTVVYSDVSVASVSGYV